MPSAYNFSIQLNLDQDHARKNVRPDLDTDRFPEKLKKKLILKRKISRRQKMNNYQVGKDLISVELISKTSRHKFILTSIILQCFDCCLLHCVFVLHKALADITTPDMQQSKTLILSTNVDQNSLETVFDCHLSPTGDK